jgi:Ni2+-binding GTPase involved in maturation of urease and hydrogenase
MQLCATTTKVSFVFDLTSYIGDTKSIGTALFIAILEYLKKNFSTFFIKNDILQNTELKNKNIGKSLFSQFFFNH